jgi:hypothetical protein
MGGCFLRIRVTTILSERIDPAFGQARRATLVDFADTAAMPLAIAKASR